MTPQQYNRIQTFRKWWSKNKSHRPSHLWLVKHTKRIMHDYNIGPDAWDTAKAIIERYNLSEYKKLSRSNAWFLWRITHPLHNERIERLMATAIFYQEIQDNYKKGVDK